MAEQKSLLLVGNHLSGTLGVRSMGEEVAARLCNKGWQVRLTSTQAGRTTRMVDMLSTILRCRQEYALAGVEVYSGMAFFWAELTSMLLRSLGKPVVLILHGGGLVEFAAKSPVRVSRLLNRAARVFTPSYHLAEYFRSYRADLRHVPNGIEISKYSFRLREAPQPRLCWLRSLHQIYRPADAVVTLGKLVKDFPDANLIMYGPDKLDGSAEEVRRAIAEWRLEKHVTLAGAVPKAQVPRKLSEADIFLNTTQYESFGVSVMEAGASGLCIVSSNAGELPHLWRDKVDAVLVEPGDTDSFAEGIQTILRQPAFARGLSQNARVNAEQYDWQVVLPLWEAAFTL